MSDANEQPRHRDLTALSSAYETLATLIDENAALKNEVEEARRNLAMEQSEVDLLRRQNKQLAAERDYHLKVHTSLAAQARAIGESMLAMLKIASTEALGERRPIVPQEESGSDDGKPIPVFLKKCASTSP